MILTILGFLVLFLVGCWLIYGGVMSFIVLKHLTGEHHFNGPAVTFILVGSILVWLAFHLFPSFDISIVWK